MTTLTIDLPDSLAKEARAAGLLKPEALQQMLHEAVRRKAGNELLEAANRLADTNFPPMTLDEIQTEVNTVREERRRRAPGA